ncbi:hypothetical protein LNP74_23155 [Klebsiella pneumoniae subsp. pneumoniae]|nr:hypothetical protein [Klebsiella pneumoniae subsp. pneumoniae]
MLSVFRHRIGYPNVDDARGSDSGHCRQRVPGHEVSYLVGLGKSQAMAMVIYFAICFGKITLTTLNAYGSFMSLTTIVSAFRRQTSAVAKSVALHSWC